MADAKSSDSPTDATSAPRPASPVGPRGTGDETGNETDEDADEGTA